MNSYALIDNKLAKSQLDIGESSNLAQIAQTYSYNFEDNKVYDEYAAILSVLAQVAIDNSKRTYDVDVQTEIKRIKKEMDLNKNKYPSFWRVIKREFSKSNINSSLHCPMNYLCNLNLNRYRENSSTIPITEFLNANIKLHNNNKRTCKKVEGLIETYSLNLLKSKINQNEIDTDEYLLLRSDFDELIFAIRNIRFSSTYAQVVSRLVSWAFKYSSSCVHSRNAKIKINKNKPILLKALYDANPNVFLSCFVSKKR